MFNSQQELVRVTCCHSPRTPAVWCTGGAGQYISAVPFSVHISVATDRKAPHRVGMRCFGVRPSFVVCSVLGDAAVLRGVKLHSMVFHWKLHMGPVDEADLRSFHQVLAARQFFKEQQEDRSGPNAGGSNMDRMGRDGGRDPTRCAFNGRCLDKILFRAVFHAASLHLNILQQFDLGNRET